MRIGTWNIAGRTSPAHVNFTLSLECDVLLLTEVNDRFVLPGLHQTRSANEMATNRGWAAVMSTAPPRHRLDDVWSIDHIAVPATWSVREATRIDPISLSDHDAYVIEVDQS